jgi:hypothetical protein
VADVLELQRLGAALLDQRLGRRSRRGGGEGGEDEEGRRDIW